MSELPAPTNKLLDVVDGIVNDLICGLGVDAVMTAIVAEAPWVKIPILNQIVRYFIEKIAKKLFLTIGPFIDFKIIKFQNDAHKAAYDQAVIEFKKALVTGVDSDEFKKANQKFNDDFDKLVSFSH